jgi:membrane protease YdiL (CAAX protease family)
MNASSENENTSSDSTLRKKHPFLAVAESGKTSFGLYLVGGLVILFFFLIGQAPLSLALLVFARLKGLQAETLTEVSAVLDAGFSRNLFLVLAISAFIIGLAGMFLVIRFIHLRPFRTLITPYKSIRWKRILIGFGIYFLLTLGIESLFYFLDSENYVFRFHPLNFIILLLISIFLLPFQTSFEEVFFRGYLMQGFGLVFRRTWPALLITSALFALMHSWNPEVEKFGFWVMFPYYFGFGLLLGFITLKDKSLEISLGVHAANNIFSSLFITFQGSALETDALFLQKTMEPGATMPFYFLAMFLFLVIISLVFGWWRKSESTFPSEPEE